MKLDPEAAAKLGFNETVHVGGRALHVQTEVLTRAGIVIRTTVLEGGVARLAEGRPCPPDVDDLDAFTALVLAQHQKHVDLVRRG